MKRKKEVQKYIKNNSVQEWLPIEKIFDNGIIKLKIRIRKRSYIKFL